MSAEEEQDDVTPAETPEREKTGCQKSRAEKSRAKRPKARRRKRRAKTPRRKPTRPPNRPPRKLPKNLRPKKAASKAPAAKEPVASEPKKASRGKAAPAKPARKVVRAHARYVRTSARKARMVCGHLRGKSVQEARAILAFTPREVARDWSKLLESAVANAESNHELLEDDLIVREAYADEGPTIKRFRPRAMGRATPIRKRTSHLTIALTPDPAPRTTKRDG